MNERELEARFGAAYRATRYVVPAASLVIRIGLRHPEADAFSAQLGASCWCVISACNPYSAAQLCAHENLALHQNLIDALRAADFAFVEASGEPLGANWAPEPSLWVAGMDRTTAQTWGARFHQNAVVCGVSGQPAELVWCRA
ncbi:DUF3293 domain-containing protein [Chitinibacteraceae bacterium HSL-7]